MASSGRTTAINATLLVAALVLAFLASPLARESYSMQRYLDFSHRVERYEGLVFTEPVCSYSAKLRGLQEGMIANYSQEKKKALVDYIHANNIVSRKNAYEFTDDDVSWILALANLDYYTEVFRTGDFVNPRDLAMIATAGHAYRAIGRLSAARDLFHYAIQLWEEPSCDGTLLESTVVTCLDTLTDMADVYRLNEATQRYSRQLLDMSLPDHTSYRIRWYAKLLASQHNIALERIEECNGDAAKADEVWAAYIEETNKDAHACLRELEHSEADKAPTDHSTFACAHTYYMNQLWNGDIESATRGLLKAHERIAKQAYNPETKIRSSAKHMSLSFEHSRVPEYLPQAGVSVVDVDLTRSTRFFNPKFRSTNGDICSPQQLPYYYDNGEIKHSHEMFEEMLCLDESVKRMELFRIEHGTVSGKTPVPRTREGGVVHPGYEHASSLYSGQITVKEEALLRDLPQKHLRRAVVCHVITSNFYHMSIETSTKFAFAYHHFALEDPDNMPVVLLVRTAASVQMVKLLGIPDELVEYYDSGHIITVDELYVVGYPWEQETEGPLEFHHSELFYVPSAAGLLSSRELMMSNNPLIERDTKPFRVLFSHRNSGKRANRYIHNVDALYARLEAVCDEFPGVEWSVFNPVSLEEQQQLFHEALVVMSPHGAGLTNILYCQEGAAVLELPCTPRKASVYAQMAKMLKLEYWTAPTAIANHFSYYVLSEESIQALEDTLRHLLTART